MLNGLVLTVASLLTAQLLHPGYLTPGESAELRGDIAGVLKSHYDIAKDGSAVQEMLEASHAARQPLSDANRKQLHDFEVELELAVRAMDPASVAVIAKARAGHYYLWDAVGVSLAPVE